MIGKGSEAGGWLFTLVWRSGKEQTWGCCRGPHHGHPMTVEQTPLGSHVPAAACSGTFQKQSCSTAIRPLAAALSGQERWRWPPSLSKGAGQTSPPPRWEGANGSSLCTPLGRSPRNGVCLVKRHETCVRYTTFHVKRHEMRTSDQYPCKKHEAQLTVVRGQAEGEAGRRAVYFASFPLFDF